MNIFYLDKEPRLCAQYHVDKHVVKMILETAHYYQPLIGSVVVKDLIDKHIKTTHPQSGLEVINQIMFGYVS